MNAFMKTASTVTLIAAMAAAPISAVAQTAETDPAGTTQTAPSAGDPLSTAEGATAAPVDRAPLPETEFAETAEQPVKRVEGHIVMQDADTILSSDLVGSNVYSDTGETIGEIDNLIIGLDGTVDGVVLGVGGFLGLGEKDVAVEMTSLSTSTDENGTVRLISSATRADLEAAESFVTKEEVAAAQRSLETMPADSATGQQPVPSN